MSASSAGSPERVHHSICKEKAKDGKLTLDHVRRYHKELEEAGIITDRVAPMLLPDYSNPKVRERQLTAHYVGTIR